MQQHPSGGIPWWQRCQTPDLPHLRSLPALCPLNLFFFPPLLIQLAVRNTFYVLKTYGSAWMCYQRGA